ncbi:unnamed protein product, partial [Prorocentrum cordatum]
VITRINADPNGWCRDGVDWARANAMHFGLDTSMSDSDGHDAGHEDGRGAAAGSEPHGDALQDGETATQDPYDGLQRDHDGPDDEDMDGTADTGDYDGEMSDGALEVYVPRQHQRAESARERIEAMQAAEETYADDLGTAKDDGIGENAADTIKGSCWWDRLSTTELDVYCAQKLLDEYYEEWGHDNDDDVDPLWTYQELARYINNRHARAIAQEASQGSQGTCAELDKGKGTEQLDKSKGTRKLDKGKGTEQLEEGNSTSNLDKGTGTGQLDKGKDTKQPDKGTGTGDLDTGKGTAQFDKGKGTGKEQQPRTRYETRRGILEASSQANFEQVADELETDDDSPTSPFHIVDHG